jgi:hypothetical protein
MTTLTATAVTAPAVRSERTHRRLVRAASIGAAAVATTTLFGLGRAAGADMTITDPVENAVPHTFVAPEIAMVTVVLGLAGWAVLALLERFTRHAHKIWGTLAAVVVVLSMPPIWIERATTETRLTLVCIHLAVGVALLPFLRTPKR